MATCSVYSRDNFSGRVALEQHWAFAFALIFLLLPVNVGAAVNPSIVSFELPPAPASALELRLARERGQVISRSEPLNLLGELYRPDLPGVLPAVVLLHGCDGIQAYQRDWARLLASWGYVVLLVDSFIPRGAVSTCTDLVDLEARDVHGGRVFDAYAAHAYLASQPFVNRFRIGVMGWAYDAVLAAVVKHGAAQFFHRTFAAAISFYPDCGFTVSGEFIAPVMVLVGAQDDWTPAQPCQWMHKNSNAFDVPVSLHVYPNAAHGFDNPALIDRTFLPAVRNLYRNPARGAHVHYDANAHQDARLQVEKFLERNVRYVLVRGTLDDLTPSYQARELAAGHWVVDPDIAGRSLPVVGDSLFDQVFSVVRDGRATHAIPFPFGALIDSLRERVSPAVNDFSLPVSVALFPMGRSLQREAAAPDYFDSPRAVIGVTGLPKEFTDGAGLRREPLLRDRLYIGYVEKTNSLEVISYNPLAGRFEFQLVRNYKMGGEPTVFYPNRSVCVACHQNQAAIFPNAPWDETNTNAAVVARLKAHRGDYFGRSADEQGISVNDLDRSANRASSLLLHNLLWDKLCAGPDYDHDHVLRCRARLALAVVQFRLSNGNGFAADAAFERFVGIPARANWRAFWPGGLKIPFANIPDRDPLNSNNAIPALLDPLTRRVPEAIWRADDNALLPRIVASLAEQILSSDVQRLDRHLKTAGEQADRRRYRWSCEQSVARQRGLTFPRTFSCRDASGTERLAARLSGDHSSGQLDRLAINPQLHLVGVKLRLTHQSPAATDPFGDPFGDPFVYALENPGATLAVRLPNGNRLLSLQLRPPETGGRTSLTGWAVEVIEQADFSQVYAAFDRLVDSRSPELSGGRPLDLESINRALANELGFDYPLACCAAQEVAAAKPEPQGSIAVDAGSKLAPFVEHCGECHASGGASPPSFLSGDVPQIIASLSGCAQRIVYRLSMWRQPDTERLKSPMPPAPSAGHSPADWPVSGEYVALLSAAIGLLKPAERATEQVLAKPYQALRECVGTLLSARH